MDITEIVSTLDQLNTSLTDKGLRNRAYINQMTYDCHSRFTFSFHLCPLSPNPDWESECDIRITEYCYSVDELPATLAALWTKVQEVRTYREIQQGRYRQKLIDLAEEGEALGFALEFTEVLRTSAKAMAENALEAPSNQ